MNNKSTLNRVDIIVLFILALIFVQVSPLFKGKSNNLTKSTVAQSKTKEAAITNVSKVIDPIEERTIDLSVTECQKILNRDGEQYSNEEVKSIMNLIDSWARINAKTILETAKRS